MKITCVYYPLEAAAAKKCLLKSDRKNSSRTACDQRRQFKRAPNGGRGAIVAANYCFLYISVLLDGDDQPENPTGSTGFTADLDF
jgi:hypothetical protein